MLVDGFKSGISKGREKIESIKRWRGWSSVEYIESSIEEMNGKVIGWGLC